MVNGHVDKLIGIANLPNQRHKIVAKRCRPLSIVFFLAGEGEEKRIDLWN